MGNNKTAPTFSPGARWIWGKSESRNEWRYFRHPFDVPAHLRRATLLITADSAYECFLNGQFIGEGPVRAFPFAYSYDVYDVSPHLQSGRPNIAAILVSSLGDHSMSYIRGRAGFLCELILEDTNGTVTRMVSDGRWRTAPCQAFNSAAPRISIQFGFEEQFDARAEIPEWRTLPLDDSGWSTATEIGPVGCPPWTALKARPIPFLTRDPVSPVQVKALELARPRIGVMWNLDLRAELNTMRTGLRSAPPGKRGSIVFSEISAPRECVIRVHSFPNYELVKLRINDQVCSSDTLLDGAERPIEFTLRAGPNLVMLRDTEFPAFLFETDEAITFSAERFVSGAAWVVIPALSELNGEVEHYWSAHSLDALPTDHGRIGIPASANQTDIFALTSSQEFFAVPDSFCSRDITRVTPRAPAAGERPILAEAPNALLHDNASWTTVYPQPDGDVHLVLDFGREIIGYLRFDVDAPDGAIIDLNFFEGIDDSGIFWTRNLRNSARTICRDGRQQFTSHQRRGFRYASLTFRRLTRPLRIRYVETLRQTYPVEARGSFACSDETLNKIWEVSAYTVQLCMLDTYVDCPAYEQVFWVGDARNSALVNAVAFGAFDLTEHCIRLTGQSLSPELASVKPPHLQALRPHITTSHVVSGWFDEIPMWTFLWVWMAWEQYWHTGDSAALAAYYADVHECLERCTTFLTERDLLDIPDVWNLVDWAAQDLERDGEVISNTALMAQALDCAARMAETLGKPDEAAAHRALAERLRSAINRAGWSEQYKGYVDTVRDQRAYERYQALCARRGIPDGTFQRFQAKQRISEPTNTLVLLCGAVPPERREAALRFALAAKDGKFVGSSPGQAAAGKPDQIVPVGSPWFLFFTLQTLFAEGHADDALQILRSQWNRMLEKGATTFWETFPGYINGHWSRSLCHGWSAAPAYFLSTEVLGVTPSAPGYQRVRIAPRPFHLRWASGTIPTPQGPISVSWRLDESGQMQVEYNAPHGCEVELVLP